MIIRCQGDDTCPLSTSGNFPFLEKRKIHFFPKKCTVLSSPVQSCPVLSSPVQSCPVQSCTVLYSPVQSCTVPVQSCPVLSSPCICLALHSLPCQVLRWPPVLSRFYLRVQRSNKTTGKQSAVNSLREIVLSYRYNTVNFSGWQYDLFLDHKLKIMHTSS